MTDLVILLIWTAALFGGGIIYWMRLQMEKLGYRYPMFNSSFKMMTDFQARKATDKKLKTNTTKLLELFSFYG
ncbi:hypothetical protein [Maribacter dokdonensis]|uniref:hypothetical protein n=1 Tax=Maribacter dokdonensis TaxID=320912 RepID=UPI003298002C